jgi:cell division protein FtsB
MLRFYQERSWKHFFRSPLMALILSGAVILLGLAVYDRWLIEREMAARRVELERTLQTLEERHASLSEQVEYLSHERGIEAEMRRNFDVAQPGEKVVIILDDETNEIEPLPPVSPPPPDPPWYKFWE